MRLFVTGTDTDIGKTITCAWLCAQSGYDYWKPIQTGSDAQSDSPTVENLSRTQIFENCYHFSLPQSPHWAAEIAGQTIDFKRIQSPHSQRLIIEGAGGTLVPLNGKQFMVNLMQKLHRDAKKEAIPFGVIIVAPNRLGVINQTLMTLEILRHRKIPVAGVILNAFHGKKNDISSAEMAKNRQAIAHYGAVEILAEIPHFERLSRENLRQFPLSKSLENLLQ